MNCIIKGNFTLELMENDSWSFSYNFFVNYMVKNGKPQHDHTCYIQIYVEMRCVLKGLQCICFMVVTYLGDH